MGSLPLEVRDFPVERKWSIGARRFFTFARENDKMFSNSGRPVENCGIIRQATDQPDNDRVNVQFDGHSAIRKCLSVRDFLSEPSAAAPAEGSFFFSYAVCCQERFQKRIT